MKIEQYKTYLLSNKYKKSFVEINYYSNGEGKFFQREIGWRSGSMLVCPMNEDEVLLIQRMVDEEDDFDGVTLTDFEENEFSDTWDGCWEDYSTNQDWSEALEEMQEAFYDDEELCDEYFDFGSYMEEVHGYSMDDSEWFIDGPVLVEETDYQIEVDQFAIDNAFEVDNA